MKSRKNHFNKYSLDPIMRMMWISMLKDFGLGGGNYDEALALLMAGRYAEFRSIVLPGFGNVDPSLFKRCYQIENLFKRYRFQKDAYTNRELDIRTVEKLSETQVRISSTLRFDDIRVHRVLQLARKICKQILGSYDPSMHASFCRFAKRATVGNGLSRSYMDEKLSKSVTGTPEHILWFKTHLASDELLKRAMIDCSLDREGIDYRVCDALSLTNVPKSFKSLRSIMPNTTIGSFYTAGLGDYIGECLASAGQKITRLQERHKLLARRFSETRSHVTADLSSASDSITFELLNRIIPRPWMSALNYGRLKQYRYKNVQYYLHTFMTMGIGFTFPLETLVFYSLAESIRRLTKTPGFVSVYGDDLIYHRSMHKYVQVIFPLCGFILNKDKTYVEEYFRESCGGDYYRGSDVRPFQPEGSGVWCSKSQYLMSIYKWANGLLLRWKREEIPSTYAFLINEIRLVDNGLCCYVPMHFSEDSGIKVETPPGALPGSRLLWCEAKLEWQFPFYKRNGGKRTVKCQTPYYWECLRSKTSDREPSVYDTTVELLSWSKMKPPRFIKGYGGRRLRRLIAQVTSKSEYKLVRQTGTTGWWS